MTAAEAREAAISAVPRLKEEYFKAIIERISSSANSGNTTLFEPYNYWYGDRDEIKNRLKELGYNIITPTDSESAKFSCTISWEDKV